MSFLFEDIFPKLQNIGFLFGAGASQKAGYPLMNELTTIVLESLKENESKEINDLVKNEKDVLIDIKDGVPNIEEISDILESAIVTVSDDSKKNTLIALRNSIREKIINGILSVEKTYIKDHILFFDALKRLFYGKDKNIWIFTTNYDLLFETAAAYSGICLFNGFLGAGFQYFYPNSFNFKYGTVNNSKLSFSKEPKIRLIKLHGSLNWWKVDNKIVAFGEKPTLANNVERILVLPKKKKVIETLDLPYNQLFNICSGIIGSECKYLASCGYSFSDQHINETLLLPKLRESKIRLTAFLKEENENLKQFKEFNSFSYGTENSSQKDNFYENEGTDLWQFDKFVNLIASNAGLKQETKNEI